MKVFQYINVFLSDNSPEGKAIKSEYANHLQRISYIATTASIGGAILGALGSFFFENHPYIHLGISMVGVSIVVIARDAAIISENVEDLVNRSTSCKKVDATVQEMASHTLKATLVAKPLFYTPLKAKLIEEIR